MQKSLAIILGILVVVLAGLFFFISQRNGTTDRNVKEIRPTTSDIIEILNNIDIPFPNTDTLFLETAMKLCGNAPDGFELPISPQKEDLPFFEKLNAWALSEHQSREDLESIMDTTLIYSVRNNKSDFDRSKMNKIYILVNLKQSKANSQFFVYENYLYLDTFRLVVKKFKPDQSLNSDTKILWRYSL
jgi:hypothetical protein